MSRPAVALILAAPASGPDPRASASAFLAELEPADRLLVVGPRAYLETLATCDDPRLLRVEQSPASLVPDLWRAGLDASCEPLVAFSSAGMMPDPGWLSALVFALRNRNAAAVGGPIAPASSLSASDRAVFLHRYAGYAPPVPNPRALEPPGENALYDRRALQNLPPLRHSGFWEVEIHRALREIGQTLAFEPSAVVRFHGGVRFGTLLKTRVRHACRYGRWRARNAGFSTQLRTLARAPLVPAVLLARPLLQGQARGQRGISQIPALPALALLAGVWTVGELLGALTADRFDAPTARGDAMNAPERANDLGILVVGVGWLGSRRARAVLAARGLRLAAVYDEDELRTHREADRLGVLAAPDLATGLNLPGVDAVIVATPHSDHARIIKRCLEAGKHVLCEKPLTIDPYQARSLAQLAQDRGLRLATGFDHRFWTPVAEALALVRSGRIGPVHTILAQIGHRASPAFLGSWHIDPERAGGGCLMDNGPHACDLIRQFAGEVVAAKGYVGHSLDLPDGCESEALALFRGHDRARASLHVSWNLPTGYLSLQILGRDGHLHVETAPWTLSGQLIGGRRIHRGYLFERLKEKAYQHLHGCGSSLVRELEAFADATHPHPRPGATGWDGCRASEMVQAVYRSAETGEEVFLDPLPVRLPEQTRQRKPREVF